MKACNSTSDIIRHSHIDGCVSLSQQDTVRMQKALLMMLDDIAEVMEDAGICYTLGGGSVLGAVRHKGFIPWDDDIDINISRAEFERFITLFRDRFPDKYWIHIPGVTEGYALLFPQIRLKGTSVRTRDDFNNDECGLCIDFFYMENTYDNALMRNIHGIGCQYYGLVTSCRKFYRDRKDLIDFARKTENTSLVSKVRARVIIGWFYSLRNIDKLVRRADRWNGRCKDDSSSLVTFPTGRLHFWGELRKRDSVIPPAMMEFEGRMRPCPRHYDEYLTKLYGDYSTLPQEQDREAHIYLEPFILP